MRLGEMNWMEVESYLKKDNRVIIVLGATEQHGYLSLMTDVKIPLAMADAASQQTGVLVAPPINFGNSPYFLAYPGTISLRVNTLLDLVEDLVRSLHAQGFRRFLILNGHGGNDPVRNRIHELTNVLDELKVTWYAWWKEPSVTAVAEKNGLKSYHAGWIEAFPFVRSSGMPEGEKKPVETRQILNAKETREAYGDGVFGGLYQADKTIMTEVFTAALKDIIHLLQF